MDNKQTFSQLRVLELASVLAGPAVGQFFAELGADVVKVEPRGTGDVTRSWRTPHENKSTGAYFSSVNWGKRSIALDLRDSSDHEILTRLITKADLMITSFRPGTEKELGLSFEQVRNLNARLICARITGYGASSPRAGYDAVIQAESGFMYLNRASGEAPAKMPVALIDILAAHQLKEAILVALIRRMNSGEGADISVSLLDAAISSLANQSANYLVGGKDPDPSGSLHPNIAPYGEIIETLDRRQIILAVGNDRQFRALTELEGLEGVGDDIRFKNNPARIQHRDILREKLERAISQYSADAFLDFCHARHIPAGEVRTVGQAVESAGHLYLSNDGLYGIRNFTATGLIPLGNLSRPPILDEHRTQILTDWLD